MYHVSVQGVDERMINVHYYYYLLRLCPQKQNKIYVLCFVRNGPPTLDSSLADIVVFQRCGLWTLSTNLSPSHYVEAEVFLTSKETVGLIGTGAQDGHLDCHIAPEFCRPTTHPLPYFCEWGRDGSVVERRTRDRKGAGSIPGWRGGRMFFSGVNFRC